MRFDPLTLIRPRRRILGMSAVLLPFFPNGDIDWESLRLQVTRTAAAGLTPAVNMDTGYANLIDEATRRAVLNTTRDALGGCSFVAGAFLGDTPGSRFDYDTYSRQIEWINTAGGTPVIFQSYGLTGQPDDEIVKSYERLGRCSGRFIGFELGSMFAPFGRIYSLELYQELLSIKPCIGAKHSSLNRTLEWERIALRDQIRPDFHVFTGNDLAIDMVMYGSDYLLGLSTFAPDLFARRDAWWVSGDPRFYELNDQLQYLGCLAFRPPVPAYKHSAAMFLKLRGWIKSDQTHPGSPQRPESDREILNSILTMMESCLVASDE